MLVSRNALAQRALMRLKQRDLLRPMQKFNVKRNKILKKKRKCVAPVHVKAHTRKCPK